MDWNNVDLNNEVNSHEIDSYLIDPLTFDTLLLEIECNLTQINCATVTAQLSRIDEARSVFLANLTNIVVTAPDNREVN